MSIRLHKKLKVNAAPDEVFSCWMKYPEFQDFIPAIESIELLDDKRSRWTVNTPLHKTVSFESRITGVEPGKSLAWESSHPEVSSSGRVQLVPHGDGTEVTLTLSFDFSHEWVSDLADMLAHFGFPSHAIDQGLELIKAHIEGLTQARKGR